MTLHTNYDVSDSAWDALVERRAGGHLLQTSAWAKLKSRFGWSAARVAVLDDDQVVAGASVLFRDLPLAVTTLGYIPKGPLVDWSNQPLVSALFDGLDRLCRQRRVFALKVEPDIEDEPNARRMIQAALDIRHSTFDTRPIQPRATILLDLAQTEDKILAAMNQATRRNIRLAARKGVEVREGTARDLPAFYALMQTTGQRDGFGIHSADYYRTAFELFAPRGWARLLIAQASEAGADSPPLAAIMVFAVGNRAWYMYGASSNERRDLKPNHALQWEAIRWAKSRGCATYDLWGIPDQDKATLESRFQDEESGLWGVYRFKRGFGGRTARYLGAFDRVYAPLIYRAFQFALGRRGSIE